MVSGYWETELSFLSALITDESIKSTVIQLLLLLLLFVVVVVVIIIMIFNSIDTKVHYLTVAADLVAEGIVEPLRFIKYTLVHNTHNLFIMSCYFFRVVKIKIAKSDTIGTFFSTKITKKRVLTECFRLVLEKVYW